MFHENKGASVKLQNLTKRFGNVLAVDHINLEISPGEFITLLGPSGSGKTTTLMMIAGFEIPDDGEIFIDEEPIIFKPPYKRGIGMVFQHYSLFPHMTVEKNIGFPLKMRKFSNNEIKERIKKALELVKLPGYEGRFPRQLSGGQQQRVALARALVFNPRVLLMDEPLGALDKKLREHMQLEIKQITKSLNITVIYVTHDQSEALTMSDRIAVMNFGKIEQIGNPNEVYEQPENFFVADFIGETNFIKGSIEKLDERRCIFKSKGGLLFQVDTKGKKLSNGDKHLTIRPEKITIVEEDQSFANQFEVIINEIVYLGNTTTYKARFVKEDTEIIIKQPNKQTIRSLKKGEKILVGWNPGDNWII